MKLTEARKRTLLEKMGRLWGGAKTCPICRTEQWAVSGEVFELREFNKGGMVIGSNQAITPLIAAQCGTCGYTALFNAIALGLVDPKTGEIIDG